VRIAFDARMIDHPGIGRYIRSLMKALLRQSDKQHYLLIGNPDQLSMFQGIRGATIKPCYVPIYGLREQWQMGRYFSDSDITHIPNFNVPWFFPKNSVVTIHDLIYFMEKDYIAWNRPEAVLKWLFHRIGNRAKRIIAVSEATAQACREMFPSMRGKLRVIYEAADEDFCTVDDKLPEDNELEFDFIYVGSIRAHKNIQGLMRAYDLVNTRQSRPCRMIIMGRLDPRFERRYGFTRWVQSRSHVEHLDPGYSDQTLKRFYRKARYLVCPSFVEGFGLPAVEAMACGTPVIASRTSSLPEVVGDGGIYFDPHQIDELGNVLYNTLQDNKLRENLSRKASDQARRFSWDKAARQTLKVYDEVLKKHQ